MRYKIPALTKSRAFLFSCLVFIAGIAVASFLPPSFWEYGAAWFAGAAASSVVIILFRHDRTFKTAGLLGLFLFLSFWRFSLSVPEDAPDKIWHYNGKKMKMAGVVAGEREERGRSARYTVDIRSADFGGRSRGISGKISVTVLLFPQYDYGDELEIVCELERPEADDFPYDRYLARYGIYSLCVFPEIRLLSAGKGNFFYENIFRLKSAIRGRINSGLAEPQAGLAAGFVLGDLKSIDKELNEKFSQAGLSHIVAISGANISILSGMIMSLCILSGLGRKPSFYIASASLVFYIILVGMPASAMRAGLMGFLILWALYLGRLGKMENALALAAAIMLAANPKVLRDDIGFQLSFLALLGLVYIYPVIDHFFAKIRIPGRFKIRETAAMTTAAQITTLPVIIYNFSQASLVAIFSNVLVLWTLPALMIVFPAVLLAAAVIRQIDFVTFLVPDMILRYIIFVAEQSVRLPYAYVKVDSYQAAWPAFIAYYVFLIWLARKNAKRPDNFNF